MDLGNREAMGQLADDVRAMELPFTARATEAFGSLFGSEYRRLRAAAVESGETCATLNVVVRCNFDPASRSIEIQTAPVPVTPKPRRTALVVEPAGK